MVGLPSAGAASEPSEGSIQVEGAKGTPVVGGWHGSQSPDKVSSVLAPAQLGGGYQWRGWPGSGWDQCRFPGGGEAGLVSKYVREAGLEGSREHGVGGSRNRHALCLELEELPLWTHHFQYGDGPALRDQ